MRRMIVVYLASSAIAGHVLAQSAIAKPALVPSTQATARCEGLKSLALDRASVVSAVLTAPATAESDVKLPSQLVKSLPAFCRVRIVDRPSDDSDIQTEVWLPAAGWNGRYRGQGNGGFAGEIYYKQMAASVALGYATAGTDTGHAGGTSAFALGHPEKIKDFGWRSIHDMTVQAKAVIAAFYGRLAERSYFVGCSDGGREALMEAQRFPADYDGILAGAPAYDWTALVSGGGEDEKQLHSSPAADIPASKVAVIGAAVRAACGGQAGAADGIVNDPMRCGFDPASLTCKQGDSDSCLSTAQVVSLKTLYAAKRDARGRNVYPGYSPSGAEDAPGSWNTWIIGDRSLMLFFSKGYFSDFVYQNPSWQLQTFDFSRDYKTAMERTGEALNATDTNLQPFIAHGGRLILYHGWADPAIPALGSVDYYNGVVSTVGKARAESAVRLYMVPGMLHCSGGPGANDFGQNEDGGVAGDDQHDVLVSLQQWVEQGMAPGTLTATKFDGNNPARGIAMARPLCPYPGVAKYVKGDPNDAKSFACSPPVH